LCELPDAEAIRRLMSKNLRKDALTKQLRRRCPELADESVEVRSGLQLMRSVTGPGPHNGAPVGVGPLVDFRLPPP